MERQKQNEIFCAQNSINRRNDGKSKSHIDDGGRPAVTTDDREEQSTIYELLLAAEGTLCTVVLVLFSSARPFLTYRSRKFTLSNDEKERILRESMQIDPRKMG